MSDGWMECEECETKGPITDWAQINLEKAKIEALEKWNKRIRPYEQTGQK